MRLCNFEIFRGSYYFHLVVNLLSNSSRVLSESHQIARHAVRKSVSELLAGRIIDREQFQAVLTVGVELYETREKKESKRKWGFTSILPQSAEVTSPGCIVLLGS
jgi:hypothetical protein